MRTLKVWWGKLADWWNRHLLVRDTLLAIVMTWVLSAYSDAPIMGDGFIFASSHNLALAFSILLGFPLIIRRRWPDIAATCFVVICVIQLLIGPVLILSDAIGLIMLYSVLVYGNRKHSKRYVLMAAGLVLIEASLYSSVNNLGPLSRWSKPSPSVKLGEIESIVCRPSQGESLLEVCGPDIALNFGINILSFGTFLLLIIFLAFWNRSRKQAVTAMRERNAAIAYRQQEQAQLAASAERARIARDMHDVVAHTLSIVIVQSDAGRYAGSKNASVALQVMETIRHEAGRALRDMDKLFGSFSADEPLKQEPRPAQPVVNATNTASEQISLESAHERTAASKTNTASVSNDYQTTDYRNIGDLIHQARSVSPDLTLEHTIEGTPEPAELSAGASLVAYRCVQEALSNIRKHAGPQAHAIISERWSADNLRITINDDGRGAAQQLESPNHHGYGLVGMRERLSSIGGCLQAGPQLGGGFCVDATLPLGIVQPTATANQQQHRQQADQAPAGKHEEPVAAAAGLNTSNNDASAFKLNRIERLSGWTAKHYLLVDSLLILPFLLLLTVSDETFFTLDQNIWPQGSTIPLPAVVIETICIALPLMFRRRLPNLSAAILAVVATVELVAVPWLSTANTLILVSIYSATAYGRGKTRIWVPLTIVGELGLIFVRLRCEIKYGSPSLLAWVLGIRPGPMITETTSPKEAAAVLLSATAITCACALVLGLWRRASGSSLLLQKEREEALRQGEAQQQRLAANAERARIGAEIQAEVSATLNQVIARADAGIAIIQKAQRQGSGPDPTAVDQSFETIGREGRAALARMRQLLDILRQSGRSDAERRNADNESDLQLHPVEVA
ncbi:sensor histidine kinase [Bombiscardovia apis]|uniref:histidine kinase n=1 Tax=Bombiscardovia apis TaxID=2932182 RepID=A0ABM8BC03_9BIFI|nr:histidine kinase [Bombiscardovia apis]BDR54430.1 sensor histidine kinase [Bombiscardovia apis]